MAFLGAATLLLLAGCSGVDSSPSADTRTANGGATVGVPAAAEVATGLESPWGLVALSDGGFLVSERDTRKILYLNGDLRDTVATLDEVEPGGEGGLLGLALTRDGGTLLAYYTAGADNRIVKMSWDGRTLGPPVLVLTGIPKAGRHNGGRMVIGPDDLLYVGTGDAGDSDLAQDRESLGGKILRVTLDGQAAQGNPFGTAVYSYGHRNVQGLAFDDQGRLWASEFGDNTWDELNLITGGGNYGWPQVEGSGSGEGLTNPKLIWKTEEASPSGLAFWRGELWMAALRGQRLWQIPVAGDTPGEPVARFGQQYGRLRSVTVAPDGESLVLSASNTDGRNSPQTGDDRLLRITG